MRGTCMKIIFFNLLLILLTASIVAQEQTNIEQGRPSELKGLTKIFIFAGADKENRERIENQIKKDLPEIKILDSGESAEVALIFGGGKTTEATGPTAKRPSRVYTEGMTSITSVKRDYGVGRVILLLNKERKSLRLLLQTISTKDIIGEDKPAVRFAKDFIKAYKKANGIK